MAAPPAPPPPEVPVDPRLLEILVCPVTKSRLVYDRARNELVSHAAGLAYPVRDGIPIMLPDEARPLDPAQAPGPPPAPAPVPAPVPPPAPPGV